MAYETGVSTSPQDFLNKLVTFAVLSGWTSVRTNGQIAPGVPVEQDTSGSQSSILDPGATLPGVEDAQFNFVAHDSPADRAEIKICPSTGDGGASTEFWDHPGSPAASDSRAETVQMGHGGALVGHSIDLGFSGSHVAYSLYSGQNTDGSRYLHGWIEGTVNTFWHIAFGTIEKSGAYDGGQYVTATYIDGFERFHTPFQFDSSQASQTVSYVRMDNAFTSGSPGWRDLHGWAFDQDTDDNMLNALFFGGQNSFNLRSPLAPVLVPYWESDAPSATTSNWKFLGCVTDMRLVSMDGLEPKAVIVLGGDTWDVIPAFRKGTESGSSAYVKTGTDQNQTSNQMGYAYRRNP
ncbi:hypothetical protein LCGC14_0731650 [marine sediment metagenome]|uniref:Uncharacterized protein n=1 Tax=marine sediment metagenome TaxID=412755 RepID=A0A0F9QDG9_9ZZZZ